MKAEDLITPLEVYQFILRKLGLDPYKKFIDEDELK